MLDCGCTYTLCNEFFQVIAAADVILQVLDARDPLGCRSEMVEKAVQDAGPNKRLILLLNKIGSWLSLGWFL